MKIQLISSCWAYEQLQHTSDKVGKGLDTCKAKRALTGQECLPKHLNNLEQKYETIGNWKIEFLATLVALHFTPVSEWVSKWAEFRTSVASRLASLLRRYKGVKAKLTCASLFSFFNHSLNILTLVKLCIYHKYFGPKIKNETHFANFL